MVSTITTIKQTFNMYSESRFGSPDTDKWYSSNNNMLETNHKSVLRHLVYTFDLTDNIQALGPIVVSAVRLSIYRLSSSNRHDTCRWSGVRSVFTNQQIPINLTTVPDTPGFMFVFNRDLARATRTGSFYLVDEYDGDIGWVHQNEYNDYDLNSLAVRDANVAILTKADELSFVLSLGPDIADFQQIDALRGIGAGSATRPKLRLTYESAVLHSGHLINSDIDPTINPGIN